MPKKNPRCIAISEENIMTQYRLVKSKSKRVCVGCVVNTNLCSRLGVDCARIEFIDYVWKEEKICG